jgi:hypothetical protein
LCVFVFGIFSSIVDESLCQTEAILNFIVLCWHYAPGPILVPCLQTIYALTFFWNTTSQNQDNNDTESDHDHASDFDGSNFNPFHRSIILYGNRWTGKSLVVNRGS